MEKEYDRGLGEPEKIRTGGLSSYHTLLPFNSFFISRPHESENAVERVLFVWLH